MSDRPFASYISIHSLLAEGDDALSAVIINLEISIHSLLAEGDICRFGGMAEPSHFNPLPPRRGRQQKRTKIPLAHLHITHKTHNNSSKSFFKINFF